MYTISDGPRMSESFKSMHEVTTGTKFILNCVLHGYPEPQITWYTPPRVSTSRYEVTTRAVKSARGSSYTVTSQLVVVTVEPGDGGGYTCSSPGARDGVVREWKTTLKVRRKWRFSSFTNQSQCALPGC